MGEMQVKDGLVSSRVVQVEADRIQRLGRSSGCQGSSLTGKEKTDLDSSLSFTPYQLCNLRQTEPLRASFSSLVKWG